MKKYLIPTLIIVFACLIGIYHNKFIPKIHADTCVIDLSKPSKVEDATATWSFMNEDSEVKVNLDWSGPDLMGYINGSNSCMTAKDKYSENINDRPYSDYNYLVKRDGKTLLETEENSNGLTKLNSGGSFFEIMRTPVSKEYWIYEIYTYNKSGGVSDPVEVKVVIDPDQN